MQTALVWGAAGGIGGALCTALEGAGWRALRVARRMPAGASADDWYAADLAHPADVAAASLWAAQQAGSVQLWVFAAGEMLGAPLADTSAEDWGRVLAANLTAAHLAVLHSQALVEPGGHMVFLGAYADRIQLPKIGAYAAAKAGLDSYVRVLAKELRDRRVTLVRAGAVDTPLWWRAPFRLPRGAASPMSVAEAVLAAHASGHRGELDI